jgi:excisionase family DNA binding protein
MSDLTTPAGIDAVLRPGQAADALGVSYSKVKGWLRKGALRAYQDQAGQWREIKTTDLIEFAAKRDLPLDLERTH